MNPSISDGVTVTDFPVTSIVSPAGGPTWAAPSSSWTVLETRLDFSASVIFNQILSKDVLSIYKPRTALGARLLELRRKFAASGRPFLSSEELTTELRERRGGVGGDA